MLQSMGLQSQDSMTEQQNNKDNMGDANHNAE